MLVWLGDWAEAASWWVAVGAFLILAGIESVRPERDLRNSVAMRWCRHFVLYATCLGLLILAAPLIRAGHLFGSNERLVFAALGSPGSWTVLVGGFLLLDLFNYALHRTQHRIFLLWRFHAVHHADTDVDVTTGLRHHPGETVVNACWSAFFLIALGTPVWLFPVYGVISFSAGLFQHMNTRLPAQLERALEFVLVTPSMHQAHHSVRPEHFGTNFGNILSIWDRIFSTYKRLPPHEREALAFGLPGYTSERQARLIFAVGLPFVLRREPAGTPIIGSAQPLR